MGGCERLSQEVKRLGGLDGVVEMGREKLVAAHGCGWEGRGGEARLP